MAEMSENTQLPSPGHSPTPVQPLTNATDGNFASTSNADRRSSQLVNADGLFKYSCIVCATRKIKCDRKDPCGNCTKANSQCIYRAPPPPRRRKKGAATQSTVLERLKRAEDMLATQQNGTGSINNMMCRLADMQLEKRGQLINRNDSTRYLDNSMWIWLNEELKGIRSVIEDELDEDDSVYPDDSPGLEGTMLFAQSPKSVPLQDQHPSTVHIFQLWQLYLQNVHPIIKILHAPTVQQQIIEAVSRLENLSRPLECLMFSIYYLVAISIGDDECEERFQEAKTSMTARYRQAAQLALLRADYLNSYSLIVLQAYMIYLIALRTHAAPPAMWTLSGVAIRMGHRMGLHRDGDMLGLPVFDVEIRRRLWWEIIFFDSRTAQLSGTGGISLARGVEYKAPRNVNDSELYPGMKTLPVEHEGVTEMLHAMVRAEIGNFLISFPQQTGTLDGSWQGLSHSTASMAEKDKLIDELEERIERKFISKCDPLIPQHLLASTISRSALATIRFMAHNPRNSAQSGTSDPQNEQMLFDCACKILENTVYVLSESTLKRFGFYTRMHFQYLGLVYLLKTLKKNTRGDKADRGWRIIHEMHELDPPILKEASRSLYKAFGDLLLAAWEAREAANPGITRPAYMEELFASRHLGNMTPSYTSTGQEIDTAIQAHQFGQNSIANMMNGTGIGFVAGGNVQADVQQSPLDRSQRASQFQSNEMDWTDWDNLMDVGGLENIDFSTISPEYFNTGQDISEIVPVDLKAYNKHDPSP